MPYLPGNTQLLTTSPLTQAREAYHRFGFSVSTPNAVAVSYTPPGGSPVVLSSPRDFTVDGDPPNAIELTASFFADRFTLSGNDGGALTIRRNTRIARQSGFSAQAYARGPAAQVAFDHVFAILEELASEGGFDDPSGAFVDMSVVGGNTIRFTTAGGGVSRDFVIPGMTNPFSPAEVATLQNVALSPTVVSAAQVAAVLVAAVGQLGNANLLTDAQAAQIQSNTQALARTPTTGPQVRALAFQGGTDSNRYTDEDKATVSALGGALGVGELVDDSKLKAGLDRAATMRMHALRALLLTLMREAHPGQGTLTAGQDASVPLAGLTLAAGKLHRITFAGFDPVVVRDDDLLGTGTLGSGSQLLRGDTTWSVDLTLAGSGILPDDRPRLNLALGAGSTALATVTGPDLAQVATRGTLTYTHAELDVPPAGTGHGAAHTDETIRIESGVTPSVNGRDLVFLALSGGGDQTVRLPGITVKDAQGHTLGDAVDNAITELRLGGPAVAVTPHPTRVDLTFADPRSGQLERELRETVDLFPEATLTIGTLNEWQNLVKMPTALKDAAFIFNAKESGGDQTAATPVHYDMQSFSDANEATRMGSPATEAVVTLTIGTDRVFFARIGTDMVVAADHAAPSVHVQESRLDLARALPTANTNTVNLSLDANGALQADVHGLGGGGLNQAAVDNRINTVIPVARRVPTFGAGDVGEFLGVRAGASPGDPPSARFTALPPVSKADVYTQGKDVLVAGSGVRIETDDTAESITLNAGVQSGVALPAQPHINDQFRLLAQFEVQHDHVEFQDGGSSGPTNAYFPLPGHPVPGPAYIEAYSVEHGSTAADRARREKAYLVVTGTYAMPADMRVVMYRSGEARQSYAVSDTAPIAGLPHWYEITGLSYDDISDSGYTYAVNLEWNFTGGVPASRLYPPRTYPPGDYVFIGGSIGWQQSPFRPDDALVLDSWRVPGIHSGTTTLITSAVAGTWTSWQVLATTPAMSRQQVGETLLFGHCHVEANVRAADGTARIMTESRIVRRRGSVDIVVADDIDYGPRNLRSGSETFDGVSRITDKNLVALDETRQGDVYRMEVRLISQKASTAVTMNVGGNTLEVASRAGTRGMRGEQGPQGSYRAMTQAAFDALTVPQRAGLILVT